MDGNSVTRQGKPNTGTFAFVNMASGQVLTVRTYPNDGPNWLMITRRLAQGEQYYWYQ